MYLAGAKVTVVPQSNQQKYDLWSAFYGHYPNPTVALDELQAPSFYQPWRAQRILDIGCGTGRHTKRLLEQNNTVLGIDISEGMLNKAKAKLPMIEFIHADFMQHPFEGNRFDKIFLSLVLEHIKPLELFFCKVYSLLATQGEVLISELHPSKGKAGCFAHFTATDGRIIHLQSTFHSENDILCAALSHSRIRKTFMVTKNWFY